MRYFIITEDRLLELLKREAQLDALECGGVDNWSWYYDALVDYFDKKDRNFDLDSEYDKLASEKLEIEFRDMETEYEED